MVTLWQSRGAGDCPRPICTLSSMHIGNVPNMWAVFAPVVASDENLAACEAVGLEPPRRSGWYYGVAPLSL